MFKARYSRLKFWIISIILIIFTLFIKIFAGAFEEAGQINIAMILYAIQIILSLTWINTLANRIRDYGSNPWFALLGLIPLLNIILTFYYGIKQYKTKHETNYE